MMNTSPNITPPTINSVTSESEGFRAVYETPGTYDNVLLRHYFAEAEDTDLITSWLRSTYGEPRDTGPRQAATRLNVVEFGCGTGRVTERVAPYAASLLGVDYSPSMIDTFASRYPTADTLCLDTRDAVHLLQTKGSADSFDLVTAFWSLSYPLGACFEELTENGIVALESQEEGRRKAKQLVKDMVNLLTENGHFLCLLFDSDSAEQRLVTEAWETIAPTPFGDRGYTRSLLLEALRECENDGQGWLTHARHGGVALADDVKTARRWFTSAHFKDLPALVDSENVMADVDHFIEKHTSGDGRVHLPAGVHFIDFHRVGGTDIHLPPAKAKNPTTTILDQSS
jgi:SAM-dependent methyltransferase